MKKIIKNLSLMALVIFAFKANAQTDKTTTARIIAEKNFVFVATAAIPLNSTDINNVTSKMPGNMSTGTINLTGSSYDIKITADSLVAYLPFYGRSYRATFGNDEAGFKFNSKDFTYIEKKRKKGGWDIALNTKDVKNNVRMNLSISENGYGSLVVSSNDKQSITYNGYLSEAKKAL
jgi:hypothetical protein